jgi:asparagine synthase (glutamine-hydrolysing)
MSSLCGIWDRSRRPADESLLSRMLEAMRARPFDAEGVHCADDFAAGVQQRWITPEEVDERQPVVGPAKTIVLFDGRLDNREELLSLLSKEPVEPSASDAALLIALYRRMGPSCCERLQGEFAFALYDCAERRLLLARDVVGMRPLYYAEGAGAKLLFASTIAAIFATKEVRAQRDDVVVAGFMLRMHPFGPNGESVFKDVFEVRPGHRVIVTEKDIRRERFQDLVASPQLRQSNFAACAEQFRELFTRAVRRRMRSAYPVAISVSGGLDSSSIFCIAHQLRKRDASLPPLYALSYGWNDGGLADERAYVEALRGHCSTPIEWLRMPPFSWMAQVEREAEIVEFPSLTACWPLMDEMMARFRAQGCRVFLSGEWGDNVLCDRAYLLDLFWQLRWRSIARHLREVPLWNEEAGRAWFWRSFRRDLLDDVVPKVVKDVTRPWRQRRQLETWQTPPFTETAAKAGGLPQRGTRSRHADQIYRGVYFMVSTNTWYAKTFAIAGMSTTFPYLDRDVLQFLMSNDGVMLNEAGVPRAVLREAMRGVLPETIRLRRNKGDFTRPVNEATETELEQIVGYLRQNTRVDQAGFADYSRLLASASVSQNGKPSAAAGRLLMPVLKLEAWMKNLELWCRM